MPRNKYPEQTVEKILDVATMLFMSKGYDGTTLQDIISATALSKGAVYHHFRSKEEIFERVCERISSQNAERLTAIRDDKAMSGREKLQTMYRSAMEHPNQEIMAGIVPYLLDNPRYIAEDLQSQYEYVAPELVAPILRQGAEDGSIPAATDPETQAEALMVLTEAWLHPLTRPTTPQEMRTRCRVFNQMTAWLGFALLDGSLIELFVRQAEYLQQRDRA